MSKVNNGKFTDDHYLLIEGICLTKTLFVYVTNKISMCGICIACNTFELQIYLFPELTSHIKERYSLFSDFSSFIKVFK